MSHYNHPHKLTLNNFVAVFKGEQKTADDSHTASGISSRCLEGEQSVFAVQQFIVAYQLNPTTVESTNVKPGIKSSRHEDQADRKDSDVLEERCFVVFSEEEESSL